jgi:hypothetical protein
MIERGPTIPLLQPLAAPTLDAFGKAQAAVNRSRKAIGADLALLAPGVAGIFHGVDFWALFASHLERNYEGVAARDSTTSDQRHRWLVAGGDVCIHLKSDVDQLCEEQLTIEHFPEVATSGPALVALTWEHLGMDRFHPTFIHLHEGRAIWELSVKELVASNVKPLRPDVPGPGLRLRRRKREEASGGSD